MPSATTARGQYRRRSRGLEPADAGRPPPGLAALFCGLLFLLPSEVALIGPLRSNGTPTRLVGLAALGLVVLGLLRARPSVSTTGRRVDPAVVTLLLYLATAVLVYGVGLTRVVSSAYAATSLRYLLLTLSGVGIALLVASSCRSSADARRVIGWLVAGSTFNALVGLVQALGLRVSWGEVVRMPGLTFTSNPGTFRERLDFVRVLGTTSHPIEFAVCLAVTLPLALHLARFGASPAVRRGSALAAVLIAVATPFALSRAGLLCTLVAMVGYLPFAGRGQRWAVAAGIVLVPALAVLVTPRIVTAFGELLSGVATAPAGADASIAGRLDDYAAVGDLLARHPWLGGVLRGGDGVLDNQWFGFLVRGGVVAVVAFAALLVVPAVQAVRGARRRPRDAERSSLCGAVIGGLAASAIAAYVFDTLAFQQSAFLIFLLVGLASVAERTGSTERTPPP